MIATTTTPAVSYIRMSTDKQDKSPAQQREAVEQLAKQHGCHVIREYKDEGISGTEIAKRPDFQRLLKDAQSGEFRVILCWDQDRFGRFDSIEAGEVIGPLRRHGVSLLTVAQGRIDWEDFAGRMVYSVIQEGKHQYVRDLSRNSLRGRREAAQRGGGLGMPPYGFDRQYFDAAGERQCLIQHGQRFAAPQGWRFQLVPAQNGQAVRTVRWLYEEFATRNVSLVSLARELNRRGTPARNGSVWYGEAIRELLMNPAYAGHTAFGRRIHGKFHSLTPDGDIGPSVRGVPACGRHRSGPAPIFKANTHEALVRQELFDAVQSRLNRRTPNRRIRGDGMLLSGILTCGHCGKGLHRYTARRKLKGGGIQEHLYYRCSLGPNQECPGRSISATRIESAILEHIESLLRSPDLAKAIREAALAMVAEPQTDELRELKEDREALQSKISRAVERMLATDDDDVVSEARRVIQTWRAELQGIDRQIRSYARRAVPNDVVRRGQRRLRSLAKSIRHADVPIARAALAAILTTAAVYWNLPPAGRQFRRRRHVSAKRVVLNVSVSGNGDESPTGRSSVIHYELPASALGHDC